MSEVKLCGSCGSKIKEGSLFAGNFTLDDQTISLVNEVFDLKGETYCRNCRPGIENLTQIINKLDVYIRYNIHSVPILTTHTPHLWDYQPIGVVTGQSVIGTGIVSEFKSSFTDFFGMSSGSFTAKIAQGETDCFLQMRMKTLKSGGNAIIATDIDYGELGSVKGMIMVCSAGTAINLKNTGLPSVNFDVINNLVESTNKLESAIKLKEIYLR